MLTRIRTLFQSIAAALLIAAVFLNFANVIGRYVFGRPIVTTEEILQYMDVWIVMLTAAAVTAQNAHLRMDMLSPTSWPRIYRAQEVAIALLGLGVAIFVCTQGLRIVSATWDVGQRSVAANIPLAFIYFAIPVGFACMALFLARRIFLLLRGGPIEEG